MVLSWRKRKTGYPRNRKHPKLSWPRERERKLGGRESKDFPTVRGRAGSVIKALRKETHRKGGGEKSHQDIHKGSVLPARGLFQYSKGRGTVCKLGVNHLMVFIQKGPTQEDTQSGRKGPYK